VSSITLHFEPTREPIPSDCFLAAIQLENSFENPLYVKCSPSVSAIKSKDSVQFDTESERVKNSWITNQRLIGKCRAGDYVIHSWNLFGRNDCYCGATVCFLRDNNYEVVGPYLMGYDWRDCKALVAHLRMNRKAFKVTIGTKIENRTSLRRLWRNSIQR
jgi:hypothetical protein